MKRLGLEDKPFKARLVAEGKPRGMIGNPIAENRFGHWLAGGGYGIRSLPHRSQTKISQGEPAGCAQTDLLHYTQMPNPQSQQT